MNILIGGGSATGKSTLAKQLAQELNINWLSVDDIRIAIQQTHKPNHLVNFFLQDNVFEKNDVEYLVSQHNKVSQIVCQGLKAVVSHQVTMNQSFVLEGDDILPEFVTELAKSITNLKAVFLYELDKEVIKDNIIKRGRHTKAMTDAQLDKITDFTKADNERLLHSAKKNKLNILSAKPHKTLAGRIKQILNLS